MLGASDIIINLLVEILFDGIIFYILYSTMNSGYTRVKNALIYSIAMEIKQLIVVRAIFLYPVFILLFGDYFFIAFVGYFILGFALTFIFDKFYDLLDRKTFIIVCTLIQLGATSVLNMLLNLFIYIIYKKKG